LEGVSHTECPYGHETNLSKNGALCIDAGEHADEEKIDAQEGDTVESCTSSTSPFYKNPSRHVPNHHQTKDQGAQVECHSGRDATKLHKVFAMRLVLKGLFQDEGYDLQLI
jgi:hypothetical protein